MAQPTLLQFGQEQGSLSFEQRCCFDAAAGARRRPENLGALQIVVFFFLPPTGQHHDKGRLASENPEPPQVREPFLSFHNPNLLNLVYFSFSLTTSLISAREILLYPHFVS